MSPGARIYLRALSQRRYAMSRWGPGRKKRLVLRRALAEALVRDGCVRALWAPPVRLRR